KGSIMCGTGCSSIRRTIVLIGSCLSSQIALALDALPSALDTREELKASAPHDAPLGSRAGALSLPAPGAVPGPAANGARTVHALPKNLFKLDDRASVTVGDRAATAGDVKREFRAELGRLSGPPTTYRVQARKAIASASATS